MESARISIADLQPGIGITRAPARVGHTFVLERELMRILLAGVPFGCENVGDEAILECAVEIFREVCPDATLTASTNDPERTAARLGIETCRLLGFFNDVSPEETRAIIGTHDCFVWCGATGLSDYPHVTPALMRVGDVLILTPPRSFCPKLAS